MKLSWLTQALLGLFSLGLMSFLITFITRKGYSVSFVLFAVVLVLTVGYFFQTFILSKQTFVIDYKLIILLLITGILSYFGNLFLFQAAHDAPNPGLAITIGGMQGIVVAVLSVIFLKDKLNTLQIVGLILAVLAIFLINAGSGAKDSTSSSSTEAKHTENM
jgi:drug/metabolite transporter (DMT)-like permease